MPSNSRYRDNTLPYPMLISQEYKSLNTDLHQTGNFGKSGHRWVKTIEMVIAQYQIKSLVDYGAGQQTLKKNLAHLQNISITSYDPAISELSVSPAPAELVTCTDVLEHIEPEYLDNVLDHLQSLTGQVAFFVIPTGPASKTLADGRNAHLIQQPLEWWLPKLLARFNLISVNNMTSDIVILLAKKNKEIELNRFVESTIMDLLTTDSISSVAFDGLSLNVFTKSRSWYNRILPRLISLVKLGKRTGVSERIKIQEGVIRLVLVRF